MALDVLLHDSRYMYELLRDKTGSLYLSVLCGGIGAYLVTIKLDADELDRYRTSGRAFLEKLALDVAKDTKAFQHREAALPNQ